MSENISKEIRSTVTMRVKSWSWKSKDECQIIEGESILELYYLYRNSSHNL